ncbi:hypothetical protein SAMN02745751_00312 [Dethiosulfatibacter aminovorans DSM 17477]|uniref:Uncharacterized protein n=1 Tax=Dethiosulfatibacter aminovorans DSM 17477 TaxID=1121476 RepID=A0A1M6B0C9_9FIRM|nr:hypothetical protein [Dethiosulfatibacter aminovorans]SHI42185.1 hypothetical protein SAMN02745751_00312 [Dethiosulfatibacter aminovorans DSM 17477]
MNRMLMLLMMLAVMITLVAGTTYCFFTAGVTSDEVMFITGSNEVEITENNMSSLALMSVDGDAISDRENWKPGKENAVFVGWSFKNTGDQDSSYRVRIDASWDNGAGNVVHWVKTGDDEWIEDDFGGYEYFWPETVNPGEEVEISFGIWCESIIGVENTSYNIDLEIESCQVH